MTIADKLTTIAENEQRVFDSGKSKGYTEGYTKGEQNGYDFGFDEGKKSEYDAFWDACQENGSRREYEEAFCRATWNNDNFKPKYDMKPTTASNMFYRFNGDQFTPSMDLSARLEECGVTLDFSECKTFNYCFQNAVINRVGVIDVRNAESTINALFSNCYWTHTVDKLIVAESNVFDYWCFLNADIKNIVVEGVIGCDITLHTCPLTKASFISVINALSSSASGKTLTLKKTAKEAAFTDSEWDALISTKPNWTITLA